jgi:hypothetical protein
MEQLYIKHATSFLTWVMKKSINSSTTNKEEFALSHLSIFDVFPSNDKESATIVVDYLKWLRGVRKISASYEAATLRGLIKLAKFRYARGKINPYTHTFRP